MLGKNTGKDKERKFIIECIELYRDLPALWQVKNKLYHDREKKNTAYSVLLAKYREMYPQATKDDLKKKINSLRTNYRKELKKYVNSMKSGANADLIYAPTLWYYEQMNFLRDEELSSESVSSTNSSKNLNPAHGDKGNIDELKTEIRSYLDGSESINHIPKKARKGERDIDLVRDIELVYERFNDIKDEYYHWALVCAADIRSMEKTQRIYAKRAIAEILMEGQLGLLHRHSVKINENACNS